MLSILTQWNNELFFALNGLTQYSPKLNLLFYMVADRIDLYVIFFGVLFIAIHQHRLQKNSAHILSPQSLKEGFTIIAAILVAWGATQLIKITTAFPRPYIALDNVHLLFMHGGYDSFPSGHATLFAALATALFMYHRKVGILFMFFAVIIALARVISGVHYPLDIFVGWILGTVITYSVLSLINRKRTH